MENKIYGLLGLSMKAGKIKSGEFASVKSIKEGRSHLVIVSSEGSINTKKKFRNMATYRKIPYFEFGSMEKLGRCLGKEFRASVSIEDQAFAEALIKYLDGGNENDR